MSVVAAVALTAARGGRVGGLEVSLVLIFLYKQPKRRHLMLLKKKLESFEPTGSLKIGRFVQFTGWTVSSSGPISVRFPSGLMTEPNRNGDRLAVQPVQSDF